MKLSDLTSKTAKVPMPFGDEGDELTIRPNAISTNFLVELNSLTDTVKDSEAAIALLDTAIKLVCELIAAWDLTDDDGDRVPVTSEAIRAQNVPFAFLAAALRAGTTTVGEASAPTSGAISDDTSSRVVKLERSRTGTH